MKNAGRNLPAFFMPGLYFHIPFCIRKCPYCDFYSVKAKPRLLNAYPQLLIRHLELARKKSVWQGPFGTVFFGGGTPSLLEPVQVARILDVVRDLFGLVPGAEISLEANPGTLTPGSLDGFRAAGINRLSLGVQSLREENLAFLGRIHTVCEAKQAVLWARQAGFTNLSTDIIFALPGQTPRKILQELEELVELAPDHVSCYGLTVEERTPFYHLHRCGGLKLPDEDCYAELYLALHEQLTREGFVHYEISNYARPGFECLHNLGYWKRSSCLGIGAGAHSFFDAGWGERRAVPADLPRYAESLERGEDPAETVETFDRRGAMAETLYLGLRMAAGVDEETYFDRFGKGVAEAFPEAVSHAGERLKLRGGRWQLDFAGWLLYDHIIQAFL